MQKIPKTHPRYKSLLYRKRISDAMNLGITHITGLIAHGRGEAFDYLIGEKTIPYADDAERTAAAVLFYAKNPVLSINGNVAALCAKECISLCEQMNIKMEVNLFHRTNKRIKTIVLAATSFLTADLIACCKKLVTVKGFKGCSAK